MKKNRTISLFTAIVFILPVTAWALFNWYERKVQGLPVLGKSKEHRIADFVLINQEGKLKSTVSWNNKIVIANFFFTHCPVICPKMTANLKKIQQAFQDDTTLLLNSFTVDPERDSFPQLKKYAGKFTLDSRNWDLLTGGKKELYRLARNSFMITATDGDGGPGDFIHSEKLVLVDIEKRIRGYYDGTSEKDITQLVSDIKKLKHEN